MRPEFVVGIGVQPERQYEDRVAVDAQVERVGLVRRNAERKGREGRRHADSGNVDPAACLAPADPAIRRDEKGFHALQVGIPHDQVIMGFRIGRIHQLCLEPDVTTRAGTMKDGVAALPEYDRTVRRHDVGQRGLRVDALGVAHMTADIHSAVEAVEGNGLCVSGASQHGAHDEKGECLTGAGYE